MIYPIRIESKLSGGVGTDAAAAAASEDDASKIDRFNQSPVCLSLKCDFHFTFIFGRNLFTANNNLR